MHENLTGPRQTSQQYCPVLEFWKYGHILNNLKYISLSNKFSMSFTDSQEFIHKAKVLPKHEARSGLIRHDLGSVLWEHSLSCSQ